MILRLLSDLKTAETLSLRRFRNLKSRQIDPSFHYQSAAQSTAWRRVFLRHSPVNRLPEFQELYRSLDSILPESLPRAVHLIGLGCGTGLKEAWLARALKKRGVKIHFTAVDVSPELVRESMRRLRPLTSIEPHGWVTDLRALPAHKRKLTREDGGIPRIFTLFGVIPNGEPREMGKLLAALLRKKDTLLVSAHLAPVKNETESEYKRGCDLIFPQYNNLETRQWLSVLLKEWKIAPFVTPVRMGIESVPGCRAVTGRVNFRKAWISPEGIGFRRGESFRLFHSLRYTSGRFERWLKKSGLNASARQIIPCGEEGVWCVAKTLPAKHAK